MGRKHSESRERRANSVVSKIEKALASSKLIFDELVIENAYTYFGVNRIPLTHTGLTVVIGKNLDASGAASNGAGKSRMWDCLLRLLYGRKALNGESPLAAYDKERKNFRIEASWRKSGHSYLFREVRNHDEFGTGLFLLRDGKPHGPVNDPEALRKFVQEILNRTYEEFIGTIIWRQNHDHALIDGTPTERAKWISDFFGLSMYDELHVRFKEKHKSLKDSIAALSETKGRYLALQEQRLKVGEPRKALKRRRKLRIEIKKANKKLRRLEKRQRELHASMSSVKQMRSSESELQRLGIKANGSLSKALRTCEDARNASTKELARLGKLSSFMSVHRDTSNMCAEAKQKKRDAYGKCMEHQEFLKLVGSFSVSEMLLACEKRENELRKEQSKVLDKLDKASESDELRELHEQIQELGGDVKRKDAKDLRKQDSEIQEQIQAHNDVIVLARQITSRGSLLKSKEAECPTCGSHVDRKKLRATIDEAVLKQEKAESKKAKLAEKSRKINKILDLYENLGVLESSGVIVLSESESKALLKRKKTLREELEKIADIRSDCRRYETARDRYAELEEADKEASREREAFSKADLKLTKREVDKLLDTTADQRDTMSEQIAAIKQTMALRQEHDTHGNEDYDTLLSRIRKELESIEDDIAEADDDRAKIREELEELSVGLDGYTKLSKTIADMEPKIERLRKLERQERITAALVKAYGPTGLKVTRLRYLLSKIRQTLPAWTSLLFTEKNFTIDVTGSEKKIGFEITQLRKHGERPTKNKRTKKIGDGEYTISYDAKFASGSERTRISMCLLLTLGDIASQEKSCNLQVLDELERGVDTPSKRIIAEDVVQMLRYMKPSLFLITHSLDIPQSACDSKLTVTKKDQQTTTEFTQLRRPQQTQSENSASAIAKAKRNKTLMLKKERNP